MTKARSAAEVSLSFLRRMLGGLFQLVGPSAAGPVPERRRRNGAILQARKSFHVTRPEGHVPSGDVRCAAFN